MTSALRSIGALALCAGLLTFASSAGAVANLMDVRVGVHGDHTRIVIETDGEAPYVVDPGAGEVMVHVDAAATAEAVTAKSPHLVWVKVEPTELGTDVRIQLKQPVEVKQLVLTRPDRIVLDLYPKPGGAEPLPAPEVLPEEETLPPVTAAVEPKPTPAPVPELEEPGLPEEAPEVTEEMQVPEVPAVGKEPTELAGMEVPAEKPSEAGKPSETEEPSPEGMVGATAMTEPPDRPTTPAAPAPSGSLFGSPFVLGAAAVVLGVVFVWLRRRLRASEARRVLPFPDEVDHAPFEPPARAVAVDETSPTGESLFDVEPDALTPVESEEVTIPRSMLRDPDPGDEAERRLGHLEKRIEELADAKDRLERQVAAQTEELRVQRAAIARTQRVLRSVAPKTEDESGDPVRG